MNNCCSWIDDESYASWKNNIRCKLKCSCLHALDIENEELRNCCCLCFNFKGVVYVLKDSIWIVLTLSVDWNLNSYLLTATYEDEVDVLKVLLEWVLYN